MAKVIPIGGMTCPECDGSGGILINVSIGIDGYSEKELIHCPTCDGKGWVLEQDEETYEKP